MKRKTQIFNAAAFVLGIIFIIIMIYKIGPNKMAQYLQNVGWKFLLLIFIQIFVTIGDTLSLKIAIGKGINFFRLALIGLSGAAINALTPIGEAGEAVKGTLLSPYIPAKRSISSLVVWNFIYRITKYILVFLGPVIVYVFDPNTFSLKIVLLMFLSAIITFMPTMLYAIALWTGASELIVKGFAKLPILNKRNWNNALKKAKETDELIAEFTKTRKKDAILIGLLLLGARLMVVVDIYVALHIIGHPVSLPTAFFLFSGGTVMATFISISPVQLGVREAGAAAMYHFIGLPASAGFAQALVRRLRQLTYNFVGLSYLAWASFFSKDMKTKQNNDKKSEEDEIIQEIAEDLSEDA